MAYYVDFMSFGGTAYRVEIGGTGGTPLTGGPEPFVTSEDSDGDLFSPIRSQTGVLTVIDTSGTLLSSMIPANNTSTTVRLIERNYNIVKWVGFLSAEVYTQPWDGNAHLLEFHVISILEALKYTTISNSYRNQRVRCDAIVSNAFSSLGVNVNTNMIDDMYGDWQYDYVDCAVFFSDKTICNQGVREKVSEGKSYYDILESICKLFGLSLRESEGEVYFTTYDTAPGLSTSDIVFTFTFKGTDNKENFIQGGRRAAVILNIEDEEQKISLPQAEETSDTPYEVTVNNDQTVFVQAHPERINQQETFTYLEYEVYTLVGYSSYNGMLAHSLIDGYTANPYNSHDTHLYTGAFPVRWFYRQSESDIVRLANGIYLQTQYHRASGSPTRDLCYSIQSTEGFGISAGYLNISFDLYSFVLDTDTGNLQFTDLAQNHIDTELNVAIRVGNMFWNKQTGEWENGNDPLIYRFVLRFENEKIVTNKTVDMLVDKTDGYFIPASNMNGEVELYIFNASYTNNNGDPLHPRISYAKIISNFAVTFLQEESITASERNTNEYRQEITGSGFSDDKEIRLEIGTYNNNLVSPSFVRWKDNLSYLQSMLYSTDHGSHRPEMHLLGRMVSYYNHIRLGMRAIVADDQNLISKLWSHGGRVFVGIDAQHNWRDDTQEVEFIEVRTE